jgi:hypothetical protein
MEHSHSKSALLLMLLLLGARCIAYPAGYFTLSRRVRWYGDVVRSFPTPLIAKIYAPAARVEAFVIQEGVLVSYPAVKGAPPLRDST